MDEDDERHFDYWSPGWRDYPDPPMWKVPIFWIIGVFMAIGVLHDVLSW